MAASSNISETTEKSIPNWKITGDWFDVCKCNVPCPCTFAQTPTYGDCDGVLAYHIKNGIYGQTQLDGLNVLVLSYFKGNIWDGETKATISIFFDEKANEEQREALHMIFSGKAGGLIWHIILLTHGLVCTVLTTIYLIIKIMKYKNVEK